LLLEEFNEGIALGNHCITLNDLVLSMVDYHISLCGKVSLSVNDSLKFSHLINLSFNVPVMTLSYVGQLVHTLVLKQLIMMLDVHEPDCGT
jgi:galactitol-specific phosphotransferase system IIC component